MYIFVVNILPLFLGLIIAYLVAVAGRNRHIGFDWAFYFGLIFPLLALIMVLSSKKNNVPIENTHVKHKSGSIILILLGLIFIYNASKIIPEITNQKTVEDTTIEVYERPSIKTASALNVSRVIFAGVLSQVVDSKIFLTNDNRLQKYMGYWMAIILFSLASYRSRSRKALPSSLAKKTITKKNDDIDEYAQVQPTIDSFSNFSEEEFVHDIKETPRKEEKFLLQTFLYSKDRKIKNIRYLSISVFVGFILGWYYKVPNTKLLAMLVQADPTWDKNLVIKLQRKTFSFFSTEYFSFNWIMFFLTTSMCFLLFLFFSDEKFRNYLYDKITFRKEKEELN